MHLIILPNFMERRGELGKRMCKPTGAKPKSCPSRVCSRGMYLPISPRFTLTIFYRDVATALLRFSQSFPHV